MGAAGVQCYLQQGQPIFLPQYPVFCQDGLGIRLWLIKYRYGFCPGIPPQKGFAGSMVGIGDSHSYAAIGLFHLPLLDDLIHRLQRGGVLGAQYQPAGVAVDAIAKCRCKAVFLCWVIFAPLVQVFLHPSDQRIRGAAFILMYHQPGGLISDKDILILIDDRKRVPSPQKGLICPLFLKNSSLRYRLTTSPTANLVLILPACYSP